MSLPFDVNTNPLVLIGDPLASPHRQFVPSYSPDVVIKCLQSLGILSSLIQDDATPPTTTPGIWFKRDQATEPKPFKGTNGPGEFFVLLTAGGTWTPVTLDNFAAFLCLKGGAQNASNLLAGTVPDARLPGRLRSAIPLVADWNAATETGWYASGPTATNSPAGGEKAMGWVAAISSDEVAQTAWLYELGTASDTRTFRRTRRAGTWSTWYRVLISKEEMDAIYAGGGGSGSADLSVKSRAIAAPPVSPATDDRYLVAASATGAWAGQSGNVARWSGTGWVFTAFAEGMLLWVDDENLLLGFDGTSLVIVGGASSAPPASLSEVNAGTVDTKYVSPSTLVNRTPLPVEVRGIVNSLQADSGVGGAMLDLRDTMQRGGAAGISRVLVPALEGVDRWTVNIGEIGDVGFSAVVHGGGKAGITGTNTYQLFVSLDGGIAFSPFASTFYTMGRLVYVHPQGHTSLWAAYAHRAETGTVDGFTLTRGTGPALLQIRRVTGTVNLSDLNSYFSVVRLG